MNKFENAYHEWVEGGCIVPERSVPEAVKWYLLLHYASEYGIDTLVETGTAVADTITHVYDSFRRIISFELSKDYFDVACRATQHLDNVELHNTSSASDEFRSVVDSLDAPALFYLDAHFSGTGTGMDFNLKTPTVPVREELEVLVGSEIDHVIVIDDARLFAGQEFYLPDCEYPSIEDMLAIVGERYNISHVADAFVLEPLESK